MTSRHVMLRHVFVATGHAAASVLLDHGSDAAWKLQNQHQHLVARSRPPTEILLRRAGRKHC